jgi:hypothetical protein
MIPDTQFARTIGMMGGRFVPNSAVNVAVQGGHAAHQAQQAIQQIQRSTRIVGDMNQFVIAEAGRRRGRVAPLPEGFKPIEPDFEFNITRLWAPEGELSQFQLYSLTNALQLTAIPADKAKVIKTIYDESQKAFSVGGSKDVARSSHAMGKMLEEGRFLLPKCSLLASSFYSRAFVAGMLEAAHELKRLCATTDAEKKHVEQQQAWQSVKLIADGDWNITLTNFGTAPAEFRFELRENGTAQGKSSGIGEGPAKRMAELALRQIDPFFGTAMLEIAKLPTMKGTWNYIVTRGPDNPHMTTDRVLQLELLVEMPALFGGRGTRSSWNVSLSLRGDNGEGTYIAQDEHGCEWILVRQSVPRPQPWHTGFQRGIRPIESLIGKSGIVVP